MAGPGLLRVHAGEIPRDAGSLPPRLRGGPVAGTCGYIRRERGQAQHRAGRRWHSGRRSALNVRRSSRIMATGIAVFVLACDTGMNAPTVSVARDTAITGLAGLRIVAGNYQA